MARRVRAPSGDGAAWDLDEDEAVSLPCDRTGTVVRVHRGTVLVTQEGDREDHVLEPGDQLALRLRGRAVAWAFTDASISVRVASALARRVPHARPDEPGPLVSGR